MKELVKNVKRKKSINEEELNVAHFENAYLTVAKVESFRLSLDYSSQETSINLSKIIQEIPQDIPILSIIYDIIR